MASDTCVDHRDEAAALVLGDTPGERRTRVLSHLDGCAACRREVSALAETLDSISAAVAPVEPSPGFVERVLAAADPLLAGEPATAGEQVLWTHTGSLSRSEAGARPRRPVAVVMRRRRTVLALTAVTAAFTLMAVGLYSAVLVALAGLSAGLEIAYLFLVIRVTHTRARYDISSAFRVTTEPAYEDESYWLRLETDLRLEPAGAEVADPPVVPVGNSALLRFVAAYFVGWMLTPVVAAIALIRGDLAGIEDSPLLGRIVALQRRGRGQSLKLLVAGATTVAVAGGGAATVLASPGLAAAATAASTYTVHPGDTLWAIAQSHGVSAPYLAQLNGIADPARILPGDVLRLAGGPGSHGGAGASPAGGRTYTVRTGDTLDMIAQRFGTTEAEIVALNHLSNPNLILVGQVLRVPAGTRASSSGLHAVAGAGSPAQVPHAATPSAATSRAVPATAHAPVEPYVNPFRFGSWSPSRIDEGVDWIPNVTSPVVAIGDGVVTYSSMSSGWPAGGFITYRLTGGSHAGLYVYVAEHITDLLPTGSVVRAGQQIATALPGYPWTEWGWASPNGPEPAASARYDGAPDGTATPGGKAFARFLISLGVTGVPDPGPGPTSP